MKNVIIILGSLASIGVAAFTVWSLWSEAKAAPTPPGERPALDPAAVQNRRQRRPASPGFGEEIGLT